MYRAYGKTFLSFLILQVNYILVFVGPNAVNLDLYVYVSV
jgi:hypothetical protein